VAPKRNVFCGKRFADPTIKKSKIWLPNLKYQLKINTHSVFTYVLYHFCDTSLITACEIFCSLKFHVVCTFFGDICLPTNRKMIKIVTLIDSHIVLTSDCWHCFSVSNIGESRFGNDNKFSLPHPGVVLFFIYRTFYSLKILFTQPFSLRCHPPPPPPPPRK
jgi:hypothetical protein